MKTLTTILLLLLTPTTKTPPGNCTALIHIGDSHASPITQQLKQNYQQQGFTNIHITAGNGRSTTRHRQTDTMSGIQAINHYNKTTPPGRCYIIDLGTNDSINTNKQQRITQTLKALSNNKHLWITIHTNHPTTRPNYNWLNTWTWNHLLHQNHIPTINWATTVQPHWHHQDGIHYTHQTNQHRATWIPQQAATQLNHLNYQP